MDSTSGADDAYTARPAGETYRDHVIIVLPSRRAPGEWHCSGVVECCYEDGQRWPFEMPGPYADRSAAYSASVAKARRQIDRWFAQAGL